MNGNKLFNRALLSGGTALRILALAGAGVGATMLASAPASAQDFTTGALVGTALDASGQPVTAGSVNVHSDAQGFNRTATLSNTGTFRVQSLPVGVYTVTVTPASGDPITSQISIIAGRDNPYTFGGAVADETVGQEVVVRARAVRRNDFGTTTGGLAIGNVSNLLDTTPVARNQTALILLTPGATGGDTTFGNLASIGGATVAENQYYVNGLNVTNFRNFLGSNNPPIEFYQTFESKTFGQTAEFGRNLGGITTTVTKSGSNNFKAGAVIQFAPDILRSDSPDTYASYNRTDYNQSVDSSFYLSGPIIKDHLFFYGLVNPRYSRTQDSSITAGQRVTTTSSSPFFGAKIDAIITDGQRLEGTFFRNRQVYTSFYDAFNGTTYAVGAPVGTVQETSGGNNFVGTYTGQFTKWLTLSASYGENHDERDYTPVPNQSLIQSSLTGTTTTARGFTSSISSDEDTRKFWRADADLYVKLLGSHHFRAGYEQERLTSSTDTAYTGGYRYLLAPTYIYRYNYLNQGTWQSKNDAYYLEDSWTLLNDRLNLQLGVRNDRFLNRALDGSVFNHSGNQWGPRLGASFDLFGDKKTTLRGTWGRYFLPVATNTNIRLGGAELYYRQRFAYPTGVNASQFDINGLPTGLTYDALGNIVGLTTRTGSSSGACPSVGPDAGALCSSVSSDGVQGPTDTLVSSNLQPSYQDEWTVGVDHRFGDLQVSLTYINRRLGRTLDDLAVDAAVLAYCNREGITGCGDVWTGFHQYVLANPNKDITVRLDGDCTVDSRQCQVATLTAADLGFPDAIRKYDSVQFSFNKAYTNRWGLGGSYVYTKLRGNYEGAVKSDNGQDDAGLTQDFDQPGLLEGAYGTLANQRAHAFKLYGSYGFTDTFRLGVNMLFESPRSFSCIGYYPDADNFAAAYQNSSFYCRQPQYSGRTAVTNTNTDPASVSYLVDRGTAFKSNWNKRIDLSAQLDLPALPGSFMKVDVTNILNWKSKLDYQEFGDNADGSINSRFGQVIVYQSPRSVLFTLGIRFGEADRNSN